MEPAEFGACSSRTTTCFAAGGCLPNAAGSMSHTMVKVGLAPRFFFHLYSCAAYSTASSSFTNCREEEEEVEAIKIIFPNGHYVATLSFLYP